MYLKWLQESRTSENNLLSILCRNSFGSNRSAAAKINIFTLNQDYEHMPEKVVKKALPVRQ